jgi:hypothetical protein
MDKWHVIRPISKQKKLRAHEHKPDLLGVTVFEFIFFSNFVLLFNWYIFMCFYLN